MSDDSFLSDSLESLLFDQPSKSMESASRLESADFLLILAFEEQADFRPSGMSRCIAIHLLAMRCWLSINVGTAAGASFRLGGRGEMAERCAGDCWSSMNVLPDARMSLLY